MKLNRYLLFCGDSQNPKGGWKDFVDSFREESLAITNAKKLVKAGKPNVWAQVVDIERVKTVYEHL